MCVLDVIYVCVLGVFGVLGTMCVYGRYVWYNMCQ